MNDETEAEFWKGRASRLRWTLLDILSGVNDDKPIVTLEDAQRIASEALAFERKESMRLGR